MRSKVITLVKTKGIIVILAVLSVLYSVVVTNTVVQASELDGYTVVDWTQNRDIETTDSNSVIVGGNVVFWRYVDKSYPQGSATWKSDFGDELTDEEVTNIWNGNFAEKYFHAEVDVEDIPDSNIRDYIYAHINEDLPGLKFKFDMDADISNMDNAEKATQLFNDNVGYRVYQNDDGSCKLQIKFNPKFQLIKSDKEGYDETKVLPNMPHKILPRAQYPYSSVVFSMWGYDAGSNEHHGALEVVEGDDPNYVYGQSFGYGDILEKGKIPNNMEYPNFEAGAINPEGVWAGQVEGDILDSNLIRIGQQYKSAGDLWYYSYGGAVGYNFKFPIKVTLEIDEQPYITKRFINENTGEIISSTVVSVYLGDAKTASKSFTLADNSRNAIVDNGEEGYKYKYYIVKDGETEQQLVQGDNIKVTVTLKKGEEHKILDVYVVPENEEDDGGGGDDEDIESYPISPPICHSDTSSILWDEYTTHTCTHYDGSYHTCYHFYTYKAELQVDDVNVSPNILKSGYGMDVEVKTSVDYTLYATKKSCSGCSKSLGNRTPDNKPTPPTNVDVRLGWETRTFGGTFIQDDVVELEKVSSTNTSSSFSAPYNDTVGENKIYTDLYLAGTKEVPRKHKIALDIYGGGVDATEWCTTVEQIFTINGDMYEDAYTTST